MDNLNFTNMLTKSYNVVSVMSGTSLDGIDILCANFCFNTKWSFKILNFETIPYSENWIETLRKLTQYSKTELNEIDNNYSNYLGHTILKFIDKNKLEHIDFIASHGHTALHKPSEGYTYQIGNQQIVADILQKKLICDFRIQDVKFGGQGAPLVPIGDELLFSDYDYCINLGGFANISFKNNEGRIAFDICPVNIVLNYYVSQLGFQYDDEGKIAASGYINYSLLEKLNSLEYYSLSPPKSLGLEWVEDCIFPLIESYKLQVEDVLRTFVEHSAIQISNFLSKENSNSIITGGGAYNKFLIERIKLFSKSKIVIPDNDIIEYKEALIFGLLGVLKLRNEVNCLRSVTGASKDHSSGKVFSPKIII